MAARLSAQLEGLAGITTPRSAADAVHVFWRYCLWVDEKAVPGGSPALGGGLKRQGIAAAPRYIQKPAFQCEVFRDQRTFGSSRFPFSLARPEAVDYTPARFPGVFECLRDVLVLPWNERFTEQDVDFIAEAVRRQHARLRAGR
jgi:dTDP-4-amino-4,6-dideoxygalactose transaminase